MSERLDRKEAVAQLRLQRERLLSVIAELSEDERTEQPLVGDWSVRDVLAHILAWEEEAARRLRLIAKGAADRIRWVAPARLDQWNARAVEKRQGISLTEVLEALAKRRQVLSRLLETLPEEALADGGRVALAQWFPRCTYQHEEEHAHQMEAWRQELEAAEVQP